MDTHAWQPIRFLPIVFDLLGVEPDDARATIEKLTQCQARPQVLDDATLERVRHLYSEQRNLLPVQREQFLRWQPEATTLEQREMLARVTARADRLSVLQDQLFALLEELSRGTIDKLMGMSDAELAEAILSGRLKLPPR
ncbi:hypothetical protein I5693_26480 [Burkholderia cenocepacia]|uniref:hypothetical protein n=1 Tax=Burkholderia cepacia complex TaxID=87882 RepID=UPI00158F1EEF|nr:hypothetical protein [Burkholderia cenocepacia]MBJ9671099.1 hypothetical protein [Burkholderia cenocepacia]MBJ9730791.1 hypothetical protein [Burkholderia cenocepacia]MBR8310649.1 hypothetical protein [Burkholderia cenocepacia]MCA7967465.1 hypothetical protein [Burkholderia cenocepacia]MDR8039477.1 hypothetical protein [Burkholderia cenocepacia]